MLRKLLALLLIVMLTTGAPDAVYAMDFTGVKVNIRIESFDKTIASGDVYAYTFLDALKAIAESNNMEIGLNASPDIYIHSINNISNSHFQGADKWLFYIEREGKIIKGDNLGISLKENDKLVVYYGEFTKTDIIAKLSLDVSDNEAVFFAASESAEWVMTDGVWTQMSGLKPLAGVRINVWQPGGSYKILKTASDGSVKTTFGITGVYVYDYEKYNTGGVPSVVAGESHFYLHGISDNSKITRGEAAAVIVNNFGVNDKGIEGEFIDVTPEHNNYEEIMAAYKAGIISGVGEDIFAPDEPVTLAGLCVMLYNAMEIQYYDQTGYKNAPEWALRGINGIMRKGLLYDIGHDWNGTVSAEDFIIIYKNYFTGNN